MYFYPATVEVPPQPISTVPIENPPAEFEIIHPPDNYVGPITNVSAQQVQPIQPIKAPMVIVG